MKFDIDKLLTVKDIEKAKELIGKKVYFADLVSEIKNNQCKVCETLKYVFDDEDYSFAYQDEDEEFQSDCYMYIYPCEEPKKKLVPFDWDDRNILRGQWVKNKNVDGLEYMIIGFSSNIYDELKIIISRDLEFMPAETLLKGYQFLDGTPCGKVVEE